MSEFYNDAPNYMANCDFILHPNHDTIKCVIEDLEHPTSNFLKTKEGFTYQELKNTEYL